MEGFVIGIALMVLGLVLFRISIKRHRSQTVIASNGSISVGGSNSGSILNLNQVPQSTPHNDKHGHGITILAIIVEVIGISVTVWHAIHLGGA